jgi:hypothetical protein
VFIVEDPPGITVELLQFEGSLSVRRSNPDYDTASGRFQGIMKVGFAVENLEAALADLKRQRGPRDPRNNRIEIVQRQVLSN